MKEMDSLGLKLCKYQAELFEKSLIKTNCSSKIFIRRFMNSNLANRMDNIGFLFDTTSFDDAINEINEQYGQSTYGKERFNNEELYWIGYIYRYWSYIYEKSSKQIYKMIKPELLRELYFPYHSLDPKQAIDRIIESDNDKYSIDISNIDRGVVILRRVREKRKSKRIDKLVPEKS